MPRKPYISSGISFEPLEETLDVKPLGSSLSIAIPKENAFQENRIALSPDAVGVLVNNGHTVSVENKAGEGAHFSDKDMPRPAPSSFSIKKKFSGVNWSSSLLLFQMKNFLCLQ